MSSGTEEEEGPATTAMQRRDGGERAKVQEQKGGKFGEEQTCRRADQEKRERSDKFMQPFLLKVSDFTHQKMLVFYLSSRPGSRAALRPDAEHLPAAHAPRPF